MFKLKSINNVISTSNKAHDSITHREFFSCVFQHCKLPMNFLILLIVLILNFQQVYFKSVFCYQFVFLLKKILSLSLVVIKLPM